MLTESQIREIRNIVARTCYEAKTSELIDRTLTDIEEITGTRDYTVSYVLPSETAKKNFGDKIRFMVIEKNTMKVYDFSVIPSVEVRIGETIGD